MQLRTIAWAASLLIAGTASAEPPTGAARVGLYEDSDRTSVLRFLGILSSMSDAWSLNGSFGVDAVTSASADVRSSPLGAIDVVTSASGRTSTSGGKMTDTRLQATGGPTWNDGSGHTVSLTGVAATERDYKSVGGDLNGAYDLHGRTTTLLGGVSFTDSWIGSVLDPTVHERLYAIGGSAGLARVLTPDDVLRVHYDGQLSLGYQASPYRNVRFGDWTTTAGAGGMLTFSNTIGSADGLREHEPDSRRRHALVIEWLHALDDDVGLHPTLRLSHDSWGVSSATAGFELRVARPTWRMQLGYRFYVQSRARFFEDKYTSDPSAYTYFTADKDLGDVTGHLTGLSISKVIHDGDGFDHTRLLLDAQIDVFRYRYPGFVLLDARTSAFAQVGLTWEL